MTNADDLQLFPLRLAIIPLLLLRPEWSELISTFPTPAALQKYYAAAACLQRMWFIRLGFYLGKQKLMPDLFSAKMDLPPTDLMYGKACLYALAQRETFNQLSAYLGVLDLLFAQLIQQTHNEPAVLR